jgi:hypothetical protein
MVLAALGKGVPAASSGGGGGEMLFSAAPGSRALTPPPFWGGGGAVVMAVPGARFAIRAALRPSRSLACKRRVPHGTPIVIHM